MNSIRLKVTPGRKVGTRYGILRDKPKVKDGALVAGKVILVSRTLQDGTKDGLSHTFDRTGKFGELTIHYGDEWVRYKLYENPLVWSDGPPHPERLQLATRQAMTDGVKDDTDE